MRVTPDIDIEKLEELDGTRSRGDAKRKAAVRVGDMLGIVQMPDTLQAASITAAPTAADYNKLVKDVRNLHNALNAVATQLRLRLTGESIRGQQPPT